MAETMSIREYIAKEEKSLKVGLPTSFANMLEQPDIWKCFNNRVIQCNKQKRMIDHVLFVLPDYKTNTLGCYDIGVVLSQIGERLADDPNQIGYKLIPFAALFGGDMLCLDYRVNSQDPTVCIWYHEKSDYLKPVTEKVFESFAEFVGEN